MEKPTSTHQHVSSQPHNSWRVAGVVFVCFIASFMGAWVFVQSGLVKVSGGTISESREKLVAEGEVVADVAKKVSPSVVSVLTTSSARTIYGTTAQEGAGTGIIITKDGYVLTNKHVIPDTANKVQVVLSDGTSYDDVTVVGRDALNDIAFLKINGVNNLTPAAIGDSAKMQVGQKVIAIGNALGQYQTTVTSGIISALNRPLTASDSNGSSTEQLDNLFQTDAAINPGNSGGPLVDLSGSVVGMNTAVAEGAQGIGFAIPINDAKGLIKSVTTKNKLERAYLGVRYVSITPDVATELKLSVKKGAYISGENAVISGSPADKAGLHEKDIIIKVNGVQVDQQHPLSSLMAQFTPGDKTSLTYLRDGKENTVSITLEAYSGN